ncbi:MAG: transaldolase [Chloroflexi bacterium]|nr:transaldolase [Chloroflexota bacterium]
MKFFLDSAITDEIRYAIDMWDIDGVTTNPRHVQASGKPFMRVIQEIGEMFAGTDKPVSVQTNPHNHSDYQAIVDEGRKLAKLSPNFVIKMPCTEHGFKACKVLKEEGIRANLTLCFSAVQGLQAMRMGAHLVSPFIAWKEGNGEDTDVFIQDLVSIRNNAFYETEILVAAVRNGRQIAFAGAIGADIVTTSFDVYKEAFAHPYTDLGLGRFQGFWDKTPYE